MTKNIVLTSILFFFLFYSCQKEQFFSDPSAQLLFSSDSVQFDTVFSTIGSATKTLKVYNPYKQAIKITKIQLASPDKHFRLNINGIATNLLSDIEIKAKDSLYIFVEITANPNNKNEPIFINDSIIFETNGNTQNVQLAAYGQDVIIYRNTSIQTGIFTKEKPYLFFGADTLYPEDKLVIQAGAKLFFHKNAALIVAGELEVNGTKEEPVIFKTSRLEKMYDDVPGMWDGIYLIGKTKKTINYAEIKCANIGIYVNDSLSDKSRYSLQIKNSRLEHHTYYGLYSVGGGIKAANCLFSDCGQNAINIAWGGMYEFYHCTIANYWGCFSCPVRKTPALRISNYIMVYDKNAGKNIAVQNNLLYANFYNSIIYGNIYEGEVEFAKLENSDFNLFFQNCLFSVDKSKNDVTQTDDFIKNIINPQQFSFKNPNASIYNFNLDTLSVAKDAGNKLVVERNLEFLEFDIQGRNRLNDQGPDIGAFERIDGEKP